MTAPTSVFTFDEANHIYMVDGVVFPSITQVIEGVGLVDYSHIPAEELKFFQDRGTGVHRACWFDDDGDLDETTVDPLIISRLYAWRKFRKDMPFKVVKSEERGFDRIYGFAGTPDRLVAFPDARRAVIELKSGPIQPAAAIQTAAQAHLLSPGSPERFRRFAVHLKGDGTYSVKEFCRSQTRQDLSTFLSALTVYRFRKANGL